MPTGALNLPQNPKWANEMQPLAPVILLLMLVVSATGMAHVQRSLLMFQMSQQTRKAQLWCAGVMTVAHLARRGHREGAVSSQ